MNTYMSMGIGCDAYDQYYYMQTVKPLIFEVTIIKSDIWS